MYGVMVMGYKGEGRAWGLGVRTDRHADSGGVVREGQANVALGLIHSHLI